MNIIKAAEENTSRTTFYRATLTDVVNATAEDGNLWVAYALFIYGWGAINFKSHLFGSKVIDDVLYICDTDGRDILVDNETVEPEMVLEEYSIEDLEFYIKDATPAVINRFITSYEIKTPDFNKWAPDLLKQGYTFIELAEDMEDFQ